MYYKNNKAINVYQKFNIVLCFLMPTSKNLDDGNECIFADIYPAYISGISGRSLMLHLLAFEFKLFISQKTLFVSLETTYTACSHYIRSTIPNLN